MAPKPSRAAKTRSIRTLKGIERLWFLLWRAIRKWAALSTLFNALSTVLDLSVVILLVQVFHINPAGAAPVGVFLGAALNFVLNRLFAFRDSHGLVVPQVLRYFGVTLLEAGVHAAVVYLLTNRLHINYIISKFIADLLVFTVGNLLLFRYLVFPKTKRTRKA